MTEPIFSSEDASLRARLPRGLPLLVALSGVSDAGGVVSQMQTYLGDGYESEAVMTFNSDLFLDYRSRRPVIAFTGEHLTDYEPEELILTLAQDSVGKPFLFLTGYEPDFRWNQFIETVLMLVHEFEVSSTAWTHAIPMPVPHTRPIRSTISGSRDDLIDERSIWKPRTKLAASAAHVLEYRLFNLGEEVVGFAMLVPHYLANTEFPSVLLAALEGIMSATGLLFEIEELRESSDAFIAQVSSQISESDDSQEMVRNLEQRYDDYVAEQNTPSPLIAEDGTIPTADQLAGEFERFLAERRDSGDDWKRERGLQDNLPKPDGSRDDTPGGNTIDPPDTVDQPDPEDQPDAGE